MCGDLNVTLHTQDRPDNSNHRLQTARFRAVFDGLQLQDLRLQGRKYTWSNDRDEPAFARLDRFLISSSWSMLFPNTVQKAIPNTASDHCPMICQVQTKFPSSNIFRIENSWLKKDDFKDLVTQQWGSSSTATTPLQLYDKMVGLRKKIITWKKTHQQESKYQEKLCKECLQWLDQQSEQRRLTNVEKLLKQLLLQRYADICQTEEEKWHQRAKKAWVCKGDKNTKYFHILASKRKRAHVIDMIEEGGNQYHDHKEKAGAIHRYFCQLMGSQHISSTTFDMQALFTSHADKLHHMNQTITQHEVLQAINKTGNNKAPGPDGLTGEFYKLFQQILAPDLLAVYNYLIQNPDTTLHPLNDSHIILIPKKDEAMQVT